MAHILLLTRGEKDNVERYIRNVQSIVHPFNMDSKYSDSGRPGVPINAIWTGVRPIQMWEIVFPKEFTQQMLATLSSSPRPLSWKHDLLLKQFRKLLGYSDVPEHDLNIQQYPITKLVTEATPIGYKEDPPHPEGGHEML